SPARAEVERQRPQVLRRPSVEPPPLIYAGEEHEGFGEFRGLVFEVAHEEGELYLLAEELAGLDGEVQVAEPVAFEARPAAVRPRPHDELVDRARVVALHGEIGRAHV